MIDPSRSSINNIRLEVPSYSIINGAISDASLICYRPLFWQNGLELIELSSINKIPIAHLKCETRLRGHLYI